MTITDELPGYEDHSAVVEMLLRPISYTRIGIPGMFPYARRTSRILHWFSIQDIRFQDRNSVFGAPLSFLGIGPGSDFVYTKGGVNVMYNELVVGDASGEFFDSNCVEETQFSFSPFRDTLYGHVTLSNEILSDDFLLRHDQEQIKLYAVDGEHLISVPSAFAVRLAEIIQRLGATTHGHRHPIMNCTDSTISQLPAIVFHMISHGSRRISGRIKIFPHEYVSRATWGDNICLFNFGIGDFALDILKLDKTNVRLMNDEIRVCDALLRS